MPRRRRSGEIPLPWNILKYDMAKEGYVVQLDKAKLENAPRYPENDMPSYTPEYSKKVDSYYGFER